MKTSGLFHPESIARNAMPILWQGHDLCAGPHQQHIVSAYPRISLKNRGFSSAQCEAPDERILSGPIGSVGASHSQIELRA
jgi:hypothetical protein